MKIFEWRDGAIRILDQTRLPDDEKVIVCDDLDKICEAIQSLRIRGAPALGVTAAYAVLMGSASIKHSSRTEFLQELDLVASRIKATRPTAVNLFWAVDQMLAAARGVHGDVDSIRKSIAQTADTIKSDNASRHKALSQLGAELIPEGSGVIHHCNTGALATIDYGSALGVLHAAHQAGKNIHVYVNETRPLLQGGRLTTWELNRWDVPHTLITDSAAGHLMQSGEIGAVVVGADRIAANGDTANKIGTYTNAVLASYHNIPFYVAAPLTTVDFDIKDGTEICIEERTPSEVLGFGHNRWAPDSVKVRNPAFDLTPESIITGIITEAGIAESPYLNSLRELHESARKIPSNV
tara:strand:- start:3587 stop:4642 length:1056 start_codon:yes stop_codon:yes gene_type:complete